jgi:hypothetical protein
MRNVEWNDIEILTEASNVHALAISPELMSGNQESLRTNCVVDHITGLNSRYYALSCYRVLLRVASWNQIISSY